MLSELKRFFLETMLGRLRSRIAASLGLKFMTAATAVIAVLMVAVTVLATRMITNYQYATTEARGRETGTVLGKAIIDKLVAGDILGLNLLVEDVVKSPEIVWVIIVSMDNVPITSARAAFNRSDPGVRSVIASEKSEDVLRLADAIRKKDAPIEVSVDIVIESVKLGAVRMAFTSESVKANADRVMTLLIATSIAIIALLSLVLYVMINQIIIVPTRAAEEAASRIAAGDLAQTVRVQSVDELGMLGRGLNRMVLGLKGMVENVRAGSQKTEQVWKEVKGISAAINRGSQTQAESVEEASSSVNEMHFSLKEIAASVEDLHAVSGNASSSVIEMAASVNEVATIVADLASSIDETSSAIAEFSTAVRQIADHVQVLQASAEDTAASTAQISAAVQEVETNARESSALADAVAADAQQLGMRAIEKTVAGMTRIDETARRTADSVNRLGTRAEEIGGILTVIEDITDQTSLLALNAAILAAQAGEHGKGFAVVATEIRELANRTAVSTQEIGKLISTVQEEARDAVAVMNEEVGMVSEGVQLARDAGDALAKILERAEQSRVMSNSINKAAAEQARGIQQVRMAVDRINQMTHQIARAVNEQKLGSEQIARTAEKMRDQTRFVRSSTEEQARGSKEIAASVESMNQKVAMVNRASNEVQAGSDLIVRAIERIRDIAKSNAEQAAGLAVAMDVMVTQTASLSREIEKFKTG